MGKKNKEKLGYIDIALAAYKYLAQILENFLQRLAHFFFLKTKELRLFKKKKYHACLKGN